MPPLQASCARQTDDDGEDILLIAISDDCAEEFKDLKRLRFLLPGGITFGDVESCEADELEVS
jgi:hypothetical protein